ncbi:MAG: hypothetical protein WC152_07375 [Candidatus Izemoplasmatales bacterium]
MKKKFYDFSIATAVIVLLAYISIFTISLYTLLNDSVVSIGKIIFNGLMLLSLIALVVYYAFLPPIYKDNEIRHLKKKIPVDNLYWYVRPNYRVRYDEIIFRDKRVPYGQLSKKDIKKNEIRVQYFAKYEMFLEESVGLAQEYKGGTND